MRCTDAGFTKAICPLLPTNERTRPDTAYRIPFPLRVALGAMAQSNALIVGCPLLITPGQCAEFVNEESEDLTDLRQLSRHQERIIVCIYLCGQFLKTRKVAYENYREDHCFNAATKMVEAGNDLL
ncbi:hypothetical protein [Pseudomonas sp.]|uniref:hypothetical protein n=1 Tax=Pseudomonas sp. TaxID=306 RepID=UPI00258CBF5D|nr:hypothetical protein [Pseudomonas sp.]